MDFHSNLAPIIFSDDPTAVPDFLVEHKLLPDSYECTYCKKKWYHAKGPPKIQQIYGYGWHHQRYNRSMATDGNVSMDSAPKDSLSEPLEQGLF